MDPAKAALIAETEHRIAIRRTLSAALERVRKRVYGQLLAEFTKADHEIGKNPHLRGGVERVSADLRACFRVDAVNAQFAGIIRWLEQEGFNCEPDKFDHVRFEAWFQSQWPAEPSLTEAEARKATVRRLWDAGRKPGGWRGMAWKDYRDAVEKEGGGDWSEQTLRRDVDDIKRKG